MATIVIALLIFWIVSPFIFIPLYLITKSGKNRAEAEIETLRIQNQNLRDIVDRLRQESAANVTANISQPVSDINQVVSEVPTREQATMKNADAVSGVQPVEQPIMQNADTVSGAQLVEQSVMQNADTVSGAQLVEQSVMQNADTVSGVQSSEQSAMLKSEIISTVITAEQPAIQHTETVYDDSAYLKDVVTNDGVQIAYRPVEKKQKQTDPMRVVFGIGVSLIVLAGLVFATTSWASMNTLAKMGSILLMAAIFMGAAWIAESKLKLTSTSIAFYSLGSIAIALIVITYGYFEISDGNINPFERDNALFYFVTFLIVSVMMTFGFFIYDKAKGFAHLAYNSLGIALMFILGYVTTDDFYSAYVIVEVLFVLYILQMFIKVNGEKLLDSNFYTVGYGAVLGVIAIVTLAFVADATIDEYETGYIVFTYVLWSIVTLVSVGSAFIQKRKSDLSKVEEISLFGLSIVTGSSVVVRIITSILYSADIANGIELFISTVIVLAIVMAISFAIRKFEKGFYTRWSMVATVYMLCFMLRAVFFRSDYEHFSDMMPWVFLILTVFCLYIAAELQNISRKVALTFAGVFVVFAYFTQQAFDFSGDFEAELYLLALIPLGLYLYFVVWKTEDEIRNWLTTILLAITLLVESALIIEFGWDHNDSVEIVKLLVIAMVAVVSILLCNFHDMMRYLILSICCAGALVIGIPNSRLDNTVIIVFVYAMALVFMGYGTYYLYHNDKTAWMALPITFFLMEYFNMLYDLIEFHVNDLGLFFAWFAVAVIFMAVGVIFHDYLFDFKNGRSNINWVGIAAFVPILEMLDGTVDSQISFGIFVFAIYFFTYNRYLSSKSARFFNVIGSLMILYLWCTQEFFELPEMIEYEWYAIGFIIFAALCQFVIYKGTSYDAGWGYLIVAVFYTIACFGRALDTESLADVFKISVVLLALLIMSFMLRSKRWFIFSSISLIIVVIKLTWVLWVSIAWWVYLLAAGLILIFVAAKNEYNKRNNIERKGIYKRITADWNK